MKIRMLEWQLERAKNDQSVVLQKSLMQKSTYQATMSKVIKNIREEHQADLLKREETIENEFKAPFKDFLYDFDARDSKFEMSGRKSTSRPNNSEKPVPTSTIPSKMRSTLLTHC